MKKCIALVVAATALQALPAAAASVAERIAQEQADGAKRVLPIKLGDGITITGIVAKGPEVTYQFELSGPYAKASKAEIGGMRRDLVKGVCQSKVDLAGIAQGLTKKYSLRTEAGNRATFAVTAADCGLKPGQAVQFTAADIEASVAQVAPVLPLKFSEDFSLVGVRADGMKYRYVVQVAIDPDKFDSARLSALSHKFGCANANSLIMMAGGVVVVWDWQGAGGKALGSVELSRQSCSAA